VTVAQNHPPVAPSTPAPAPAAKPSTQPKTLPQTSSNLPFEAGLGSLLFMLGAGLLVRCGVQN
jgi:hypothetical protein